MTSLSTVDVITPLVLFITKLVDPKMSSQLNIAYCSFKSFKFGAGDPVALLVPL